MKNPFKIYLIRFNSAFTLVELMIVIAIIGIIAAVAVPNMIAWRNNAQFNAAVRMFKSSIESTRMDAMKSNISIPLNFVDGGTTYTTTNASGTIITHQLPPTVILLNSNFTGDILQFNSRGMPDAPNSLGGTLTIQNNSGTLNRQIIVSSTGSSRIN